ncbi:MAG: TrmB family transcriptional regulator [Spirochaetales bacterium]|nr:TrmB family transcriptional regulator [Spirochaetales bacterium]
MWDELLNYLCNIGFSRIEALVYCTLVPEEKMGGYQIAKKLNVQRPSVYSALTSLENRGFITAVPGETTEYSAIAPDILMDELSRRYSENASKAKLELEKLTDGHKKLERFVNITGKSNLIAAVNRCIETTQKEIVFTCSMNLSPFENTLKNAAKRGVRIVLFSWSNIDTLGIPLEFYCGYDGVACAEERILLVSDEMHCIIGSNDRAAFYPHGKKCSPLPADEKDFLGMMSDNRLVVNLVTEHIHFDIYLHRLKKQYGKDLIDSSIQIGTLMEKGI